VVRSRHPKRRKAGKHSTIQAGENSRSLEKKVFFPLSGTGEDILFHFAVQPPQLDVVKSSFPGVNAEHPPAQAQKKKHKGSSP